MKGKKLWDKFWINFSIIKSITIFLIHVSWLKKNLSYLSLFTHVLSSCLLEATISCSLLLDYLLESSNTLLSSSCVTSKAEIFFFSLLISCSIFLLPIGRILRPKPSNYLSYCLFIRLFFFFLFPFELEIHYFFNKK